MITENFPFLFLQTDHGRTPTNIDKNDVIQNGTIIIFLPKTLKNMSDGKATFFKPYGEKKIGKKAVFFIAQQWCEFWKTSKNKTQSEYVYSPLPEGFISSFEEM